MRACTDVTFRGLADGHLRLLAQPAEPKLTRTHAAGERLGFLGDGSFFGENPIVQAVTGSGGDDADVRTRTVRATGDTGVRRVLR